MNRQHLVDVTISMGTRLEPLHLASPVRVRRKVRVKVRVRVRERI